MMDFRRASFRARSAALATSACTRLTAAAAYAEEAAAAPVVELAEQQRRDEEPAQDEEQVDAGVSRQHDGGGWPREHRQRGRAAAVEEPVRVMDDDQRDRESTQALDLVEARRRHRSRDTAGTPTGVGAPAQTSAGFTPSAAAVRSTCCPLRHDPGVRVRPTRGRCCVERAPGGGIRLAPLPPKFRPPPRVGP